MKRWWRTQGGWWLAWLVATAAGAAWLARAELVQLHESFDTDLRIAHRLLSQQVVQHDAVIATLALLAPGADTAAAQRLPAVYPSILAVRERRGDAGWSDAALAAAEAESRARKRPALADSALAQGRYRLVMGADPVSYALDIDFARIVPWADWPMDPQRSPAQVSIARESQRMVLQPGRGAQASGGWHFGFRKVLASDSQAFDVVAERRVGWAELPWRAMAGWAVAVGLLLAALAALQRQRTARRRAEELLRVGQAARLDALGELAAGMAHELNQPLTAVLANTQAARRLLDEAPPAIDTARDAMGQAAAQARRAADVVGRLRRVIERSEGAHAVQPLALQAAVRRALHLLEPECGQRGVAVHVEAAATPVQVLADPVALEQILHNLLMNALQALEDVPAKRRRIDVEVALREGQGLLAVADHGHGIAPDKLPRIFEPFFSTRDGGLGLGLSLSETLAAGMGGSLAAVPGRAEGARFELTLPLAA